MSVREMDENGLLPIEVACKHGPSHVVIGFVRCTMRRPSIFDTHHLSVHPSYVTYSPMRDQKLTTLLSFYRRVIRPS